MSKYYMGIDIGTFESKGVIIDEDCRIIAQESCPHGMENPGEGLYEHDAEAVWWGDFCRLSNALIVSAAVDPVQHLAALDKELFAVGKQVGTIE